MKASVSKVEIIVFFKQRLQSDDFQAEIAARDFIKEHNFQHTDLPFLEETILKMSKDDLDFEDMKNANFSDLYIAFNKFLFQIKKSLGYKEAGYSSNSNKVVLEKAIDPPSEVFNFAGHNKMDIEERTEGRALLYK